MNNIGNCIGKGYRDQHHEKLVPSQSRFSTTQALGYVRSLGLKKGSAVLSLGSGVGPIAAELVENGVSVYGIDGVENGVPLIRQNHTGGDLESDGTPNFKNMEDLDFEDTTFNAIISIGWLEYLTWDRWALQEMYRVLKPGGYVILGVPNRVRLAHLLKPNNALRWAAGYLINTWVKPNRRSRGGNADRRHMKGIGRQATSSPRLYVPWQLHRTLDRLGFDAVALAPHRLLPSVGIGKSRTALGLCRLLWKLSVSWYLPFLHRFANTYITVGQKRADRPYASEREIHANMKKSAMTFESEYKPYLLALNKWLEDHKQYSENAPYQIGGLTSVDMPVLVISPHPDDEVIGCGGTLIKMIEAGARVTIVHLTDGSRSGALVDTPDQVRKSVRLAEAQQIAEALKSDLVLWRESDSVLQCTQRNVERMRTLLDDLQPKAIFVPFINDPHSDHRVANEILGRALELLRPNVEDVRIFGYEVWSLVPTIAYSIIDEQFDRKISLLLKYRTGMKASDYVSFCRYLNAYRAFKLLNRRGFVEAFFATGVDEYLELLVQSTAVDHT